MISEAFRFLKANFNERLGIYFAVVTCFTMFGSIPVADLKLPFLIAFLPFATLFVYLISKTLIYPSLKFITSYRKGVTLPAPEQFTALARRMGTKLTTIKFIESDKINAFATNNGIAFTTGLWRDFEHNEIMAVAAHELAHKKENHAFFKTTITMVLLVFTVFVWSGFTAPIFVSQELTQSLFQIMMEPALLAFVIVAIIPINWYLEVRADSAASRYVGKEYIKSALLKLTKQEDLPINSETHPCTQDRIKHIERHRC